MTKTTSDGALIGRAYNKIQKINDAETVELHASPAQIREKYELRRNAAMGSLSPDIREKLIKLMESDIVIEEVPESE